MSELAPEKRNLWALSYDGNDAGLKERLTKVLLQFSIAEEAKEGFQVAFTPNFRFEDHCPVVALCGSDARLKRDLCEAIASEFGMNFLYVNCGDHMPFPEDARWHDNPVTVTKTKVNDEGQKYLEAAIAYKIPRYSMMEWLLGTGPEFIVDGEEDFLINRLRKDQAIFIFVDNIEKSDLNFQRSLRNIFENNMRLHAKGNKVSLDRAIFVMATEAFADTLMSTDNNGETNRRFKGLWWEMMENELTVMDICSVIVLKTEN